MRKDDTQDDEYHTTWISVNVSLGTSHDHTGKIWDFVRMSQFCHFSFITHSLGPLGLLLLSCFTKMKFVLHGEWQIGGEFSDIRDSQNCKRAEMVRELIGFLLKFSLPLELIERRKLWALTAAFSERVLIQHENTLARSSQHRSKGEKGKEKKRKKCVKNASENYLTNEIPINSPEKKYMNSIQFSCFYSGMMEFLTLSWGMCVLNESWNWKFKLKFVHLDNTYTYTALSHAEKVWNLNFNSFFVKLFFHSLSICSPVCVWTMNREREKC